MQLTLSHLARHVEQLAPAPTLGATVLVSFGVVLPVLLQEAHGSEAPGAQLVPTW